MKTLTLLLTLCTASFSLLAQEPAAPPTQAGDVPKAPEEPAAAEEAAAEDEVIDATPYPLERFSKLLAKSPFDFDVAPPPPPTPVPPMEDWMIAGVSGTRDYIGVTIVNGKTNQRLHLTKYHNAEMNDRVRKDATGDTFKLLAIEFEPGKPKGRKAAKATVQKNDEAPGVVTWQEKADQLKPMVGVPNIQIPNGNLPPNRGGTMPATQLGLTNAPNQVNPNGTVNVNTGQPAANGTNGVQPGQPGGAMPATNTGNVSGGQQQLLDLLNRSKTPAATPTTPGSTNNPLGRRRVVLPTPSAPAPPVVNQ